MKFLVDAQLPPALACWLREAGHQAEHVEDVGLREANDGAIRAHALQSGAIIVTKDEDFAARSVQSATRPVIVWLRVGNTTNRVLRSWIEPAFAGHRATARAEESLGRSHLKTRLRQSRARRHVPMDG